MADPVTKESISPPPDNFNDHHVPSTPGVGVLIGALVVVVGILTIMYVNGMP